MGTSDLKRGKIRAGDELCAIKQFWSSCGPTNQCLKCWSWKKWSPLKVVTVLITWRDQSGSFKMNISVLAVPSAIAVALIWEGGLSCSCNLRWLKMWDKKKCFVSSGLTGERNGLGVTAFRWHFLVLIMQRQKGVLSWVNGDRQNERTDSGGSSKCLVSTSGGGVNP